MTDFDRVLEQVQVGDDMLSDDDDDEYYDE